MKYIRLVSICLILINCFRLLASNDNMESAVGLCLIPIFVLYLYKVLKD